MIRSADVTDEPSSPAADGDSRRSFLVRAGALLAGASALGPVVGCDPPPVPESASAPSRAVAGRWPRALLDAVAEAVLPSVLGAAGLRGAVTQFVAWADGFEPVAQEMLGYGYAEVRYLPADPVPGWIAQLDALDRRAGKRGATFVALPVADRRAVIEQALGGATTDSLPAPLDASHVVLALLSHWASSSDGWDLALEHRVQRDRCRSLVTTRDLPTALAPITR
jgi:hypothetical protein